jgi:FAD:protein FMN transferase
MRDTRILMGMPITVEICDGAPPDLLESIFDYFDVVDRKFSLYKPTSEISAYNRGDIAIENLSRDMREVFAIADRTKSDTAGYFEMRRPDGMIDPSGIVKGWAVRNAAARIRGTGVRDFYVEAGGDIQMGGKNEHGEDWRIGIRNPFVAHEIVKAIAMTDRGIATSGTYIRGQHIYDPHHPNGTIENVVSLTVIAPDVLEADRFATAAFAMGENGIYFIEQQHGLEGYVINANGIATQTTGFGAYVIS